MERLARFTNPHVEHLEPDQLIEEFNIFKLEGFIFCLNPRLAKQTLKAQTLGELQNHPVTIEPNPTYGRPGIGAFKTLQAIFLKLTEEGYPYPNTVSFSKRELERLRGSKSWGGYQSERTYRDVMQLRTCLIHCARKDKTTGEWLVGNFNILDAALFSGNENGVSTFSVRLDPLIIQSLNTFHLARFNWYRLRPLIDQPIAAIMYKQFYQWAANLMDDKTGKPRFSRLEKDYETACREWFGGLKPEKYKSRILHNQLGAHIAAIHETRLGRITIEKRSTGTGFKLVFAPRRGFFDDYKRLYLDPVFKPQLPFNRTADEKNIQEPLQLLEYFYKAVDREKHRFDEREVGYARYLLGQHGYADIEDLIDYAAVRLKKSKNLTVISFGIVKSFLDPWTEARAKRLRVREMRTAISGCYLCDDNGYLILRDPQARQRVVSYECPHDASEVELLEERKGMTRI